MVKLKTVRKKAMKDTSNVINSSNLSQLVQDIAGESFTWIKLPFGRKGICSACHGGNAISTQERSTKITLGGLIQREKEHSQSTTHIAQKIICVSTKIDILIEKRGRVSLNKLGVTLLM